MNSMGLLSIIVGIIIIALRGPFIFAPKTAMEFSSKKLTSTNNRIRLLGLLVLAFSILLIIIGLKSGIYLEKVIVVFGFIIGIFSIFLFLLFPGNYKQIIDVISNFDSLALRAIGVLGTAVGVFFIIQGISIL